MNQNIESIKNVDWVQFLQRKRTLFTYYAFMDLERDLLQKTTGFSYRHHLYTYRQGEGTHYRSADELNKSNEYFSDLIDKSDSRLKLWFDRATEFNELADKYIKQFTNLKRGEISGSEFKKYYQDLLNILLYGVTISFLVLSAIDVKKEEGRQSLNGEKIQKLYEPLRNVTKYPELEKTVLEYFFELSGIDLSSALTPDELISFFENDTPVDNKELQKRVNWCVFWSEPETNKIVFAYNKEITQEIPVLSEEKYSTDVIKGNVAFPGKVQSKVKIVNDTDDMIKFESGDILVSFATSPALMPAIIKAAGIVTNEGGIMCHAAIVSRELKKPCIIATKIATKVLHDGDTVEVDANKGIVRILKS